MTPLQESSRAGYDGSVKDRTSTLAHVATFIDRDTAPSARVLESVLEGMRIDGARVTPPGSCSRPLCRLPPGLSLCAPVVYVVIAK